MSRHLVKNSHELREGDIVVCHGLRCLIDSEPQVSLCHPTTENSPTIWQSALVIERAEDSPVPRSWTMKPDGTERWTIQGNKLAAWRVEA